MTQAVYETHHGGAEFPLAVYRNDTNGPFVHCNYHREIEFIYITEGTTAFSINGCLYDLCQGQALLVNSGDIHMGHPARGEFCSAESIVFSPKMLSMAETDLCQSCYISPFITNLYRFPAVIRGDKSWEREILRFLRKILGEYRRQAYSYELHIKVSLYEIIAELVSHQAYDLTMPTSGTKSQSQIERLKTVIAYIEQHYSRKLLVPELAALIDMSTDHFYKFFKAMTHMTPVAYINMLRIEMAARFLRISDLSILDVALQVGIEDVSYFIKIFKQQKGVTPNRFRHLQNVRE